LNPIVMAKLIFRLNDVPDDEADAVREVLLEHQIDFYETSSGNWGFSVAGIWLKNNEDKPRARSLIDELQAQRISQSPADVESFASLSLRHPLRLIVYLGIVLFILYFSIMPFIGIGE